MEGLFSASGSLLSMPLPLSGGSSDGHRPVLKSTSLSRLEELQQELRQCSDPQYVRKLFKKLSSCPTDIVDAYSNYLKDKAALLATEEQREYKRAKLYNVLGDATAQPCVPHDDAFCAKVLGEEFPEEQCVTPSNPRHISRQPAAALLRRGDDAAGAEVQQEQPRQPAALAAGSTQQREGAGSVFRIEDLQLPHSHLSRLKTAPTPPLFSPLHHVTITDHQLQHLISPLPYSLTPQGEAPGSSLRQLQAQLDVKPEPFIFQARPQ
ncbi:hypothetical protein N2152v2_005625 [Parachlorella kessleri]